MLRVNLAWSRPDWTRETPGQSRGLGDIQLQGRNGVDAETNPSAPMVTPQLWNCQTGVSGCWCCQSRCCLTLEAPIKSGGASPSRPPHTTRSRELGSTRLDRPRWSRHAFHMCHLGRQAPTPLPLLLVLLPDLEWTAKAIPRQRKILFPLSKNPASEMWSHLMERHNVCMWIT